MRLTTISSLLLLAVLAAPSGSAQTPTWKVDFLGVPPADWSTVFAIAVNDSGVAVGNTYINGYKQAWIGGPNMPLELLPLPDGATYSEVFDINSSGVVAGEVILGDGSVRGLIWRPTGPTGYEEFLLPASSGGLFPFDAHGINDAEDVVGKLSILGGSYVWNAATGVTQITTAEFPDRPADVNDQRQIIGGSYRMDLDTMVLEDLGNPTETSYNYVYTELLRMNNAGESVGYSVVATGLPPYLAVRYTDGPIAPVWRLFNSFPVTSASALGISAAGDTVFQLGAVFGTFVYVEGFGSIALGSLVDPAFADWDVSGSFVPAISRNGRLACNGANDVTGDSGIVLLTPLAFDDLGGASTGSLGTPVLSGYGTLLPGQPARVRLASAAPNSIGALAWSLTSNPIPFVGGTLFPNPPNLFPLFATDELGRYEITVNWPTVPPGTTFYLQAGVVDPAATSSLSLSNALLGLTR